MTGAIQESLNKPFEWRWDSTSPYLYIAMFSSDLDDFLVKASRDSYDAKRWNFGFLTTTSAGEDPYANTGAFEAFGVLATVADILKDFIKRENPTVVQFTGDKKQGKGKLYSIMTKRFSKDIDKMGYTSGFSDHGRKEIEFAIVKKSQPGAVRESQFNRRFQALISESIVNKQKVE